MSTKTTISWTERTWNAITGCAEVSPGCDNCYARRIAERFTQHFPNGFNVTMWPERLREPLTWRKPQMVFANSMADMFHRDVPEHFIHRILDTVGQCPQHVFQVLTKRPERALVAMRSYYAGLHKSLCPFPNLWLGVSVESPRFFGRIATLRQIPAAVRFISFEPWLGPLPPEAMPPVTALQGIHWCILGGESGPGARPCPLDDLRALAWLGQQAGAAVFVKQLGEHWSRAQDPRPTKPDGKIDAKGEVLDFYPDDLKIRCWPTVTPTSDAGPLFSEENLNA